MNNTKRNLALLTSSLALAVAGGVSAVAAPTPPPKDTSVAAPMSAAQKDTLKKGGIVVSQQRLDVTAAAVPQPCAADEFHNSINSEASIRISNTSQQWTWVHAGYYSYGQLAKLYVQTGMDTYIFDWNSAGEPTNGITLRTTQWYTLTRWTNYCGTRTVGETWPQ